MIKKMSNKQAERFKRYADWVRIHREVMRYINEGNDYFTVDLGGFEVKFDATNEGANDER